MTATSSFLPGLSRLPTLLTRRLRLRWLTSADVPALYTVFSDPAVMRYWSRETFTSPTEAAELQTQIETLFRERSLFQWGIVLLPDDAVIGTVTLYGLDAQHRHAGVGYALGSAHWGRGYASEALAALLEFAFTELALHRLEADVDPRNAASRRCLTKLGFREEGLQRERYHLYDEWQDAQLFGLLRFEHQARQPR